MACTFDPNDISMILSGGSSNSDPEASLGGTISFKEVDSSFFSDVETPLGTSVTDFSCIYIRNDSENDLPLFNVFIDSQTSDGSDIEIGFGGSKNETAFEIFNPSSVPSGVVFSQPTSDSPLTISDLLIGDFISLWFKRTTLNAFVEIDDGVSIGISGLRDCVDCEEVSMMSYSNNYILVKQKTPKPTVKRTPIPKSKRAISPIASAMAPVFESMATCTFDPSNVSMLLSGGASNIDSSQSLGGTISFKEVDSSFFSDVETPLGTSDTDFSCVYIRNDSERDLTLFNVFIDSQVSNGAVIEIGFGGSKNETAFEIFNPSSIPPGVVFSQPTSDSPLTISDFVESDFISLWFKRTVLNTSIAVENDGVSIGFSGLWNCICCEAAFDNSFSASFDICS